MFTECHKKTRSSILWRMLQGIIFHQDSCILDTLDTVNILDAINTTNTKPTLTAQFAVRLAAY